MKKEELNLSLLEEFKERVIEIITIDINDKESNFIFECFNINETEDELVISDELNDKNIIHINKEEIFDIEENEDDGCVEIVYLNNVIKINEV